MIDEVLKIVRSGLKAQSLHLVVFSQPMKRTGEAATKISCRPVTIRDELCFQAASRIGNQEVHENIGSAEFLAYFQSQLNDFNQVNLFTTEEDVEFRRGEAKDLLKRSSPTHKGDSRSHDKQRQYLIPDNQPCDFLIATGVMSKAGRVKASRQKKFRQINRYLDIVNDIVAHLPTDRPVRVVDFGCGRSYLTFALHHLLVRVLGRDVEIVGLDLKRKVIEDCNRLATKLNCSGLRFEHSDITDHTQSEDLDLCVSLHACDTATDEALAKAIEWNAAVVLAVPCCHNELASQLSSEPLSPLLRHGIARERFAALMTDSLRARALDAVGYSAQLIEFIDTEHTPKNIMIRAVRRSSGEEAQQRALEEYVHFRDSLGVRDFRLQTACDALSTLLGLGDDR